MLAAIASFFNAIYALLKSITNIGGLLDGEPATTDTSATTSPNQPESGAPSQQKPVQKADTGKRCLITLPNEQINARFNDTGSTAWANQPGGKHLGTDFGAAMGSPVYAPYPMNVIAVGHYSDEGRYGDYVIGHLVDGTEYYSGHLQNVKVGVGDAVQCGQQIGETGIVNHTHIQLRVNGVLTDFEEYSKAH